MLYIKLYLGGIHNLPDRSGNPKILNTLLIFYFNKVTGLIPKLYGELHTEEQ